MRQFGRRQPQDSGIGMESSAISITCRTAPRDRPLSAIRVQRAAGDPRRGWLTAGGWTVPVALGRGGILANKREGDGGTPSGTFYPLRLWWRADRHPRPGPFCRSGRSGRKTAGVRTRGDRHYNQPIRLAGDQPGDRLTREDHLYDFIVEIDHNGAPRIAGRGSAVFLHLARPDFSPTAGCVSMTKSAMLRLLRRMGPQTKIMIG